MTIDGRRFSVTLPDWGQDHLSPEAIVAYVDDELADGPYSRATRHIDTCSECSVQVVAQAQARAALRSAEVPSMSSSLLNTLRSIPHDAELPEAPAGLAITDDGEFIALLRSEPAAPARPATSRRMRFGAGAAMSGLALGAIALGGSAVAGDAPDPTASAPRGVFDGPVLGGAAADAQLRIAPAAGASATDVPSQVRRIPGSFLRLP